MKFNIPILFTTIRLLLIAPIIYQIYVGNYLFAMMLFVVAVVTDILDGYFARRLGQETKLGAFLDPVADKIMVAAIYFMFLIKSSGILIPMWFVVLIALKELIQLFGGIYFVLVKRSVEISVSQLGKFSMVLHAIVIGFLIYASKYDILPGKIFTVFLIVAAVLIILPLIQYGLLVAKSLSKKVENK